MEQLSTVNRNIFLVVMALTLAVLAIIFILTFRNVKMQKVECDAVLSHLRNFRPPIAEASKVPGPRGPRGFRGRDAPFLHRYSFPVHIVGTMASVALDDKVHMFGRQRKVLITSSHNHSGPHLYEIQVSLDNTQRQIVSGEKRVSVTMHIKSNWANSIEFRGPPCTSIGGASACNVRSMTEQESLDSTNQHLKMDLEIQRLPSSSLLPALPAKHQACYSLHETPVKAAIERAIETDSGQHLSRPLFEEITDLLFPRTSEQVEISERESLEKRDATYVLHSDFANDGSTKDWGSIQSVSDSLWQVTKTLINKTLAIGDTDSVDRILAIMCSYSHLQPLPVIGGPLMETIIEFNTVCKNFNFLQHPIDIIVWVEIEEQEEDEYRVEEEEEGDQDEEGEGEEWKPMK